MSPRTEEVIQKNYYRRGGGVPILFRAVLLVFVLGCLVVIGSRLFPGVGR